MLCNVMAPDMLELMETGSPGDIDFYSQYARHRGGPVLALLSGTGRIALAIARMGVPVVGVDPDPARIDLAKRKAQAIGASRAMFVRADPTNFVSESRHPLVIIPGGLGRLVSLEEQRQALLAVRSALAAGGRLVLDLPLLDMGPSPSGQPAVHYQFGDAGRTAVIQRYRQFEAARQLVHETISCEWLGEDGRVESKSYATWTERYATPAEVQLLLEISGFAVTSYGGFDRTPLLPGATRLVIEAERRT